MLETALCFFNAHLLIHDIVFTENLLAAWLVLLHKVTENTGFCPLRVYIIEQKMILF